MVYSSSYAPTYYSTLHDSMTSLCKTILPFSFKKRRLPAAEQNLSKLQSDNLKWQQDSFHQMLKLMGLHKEGILAESEVSAFRSHLLDTLMASPAEHEQPVILRDKLLFLQELLYAKCISEDEYHSSKRPLLQRLAVQGGEIEARDEVVAEAQQAKNPKEQKENSEEEWSEIDLKDDKCILKKDSNSKNKSKHGSAMKQIKGFVSSYKQGKNREERSIFDLPNSSTSKENEASSILMAESVPKEAEKESGSAAGRSKRKPFRNLFQREQSGGGGGGGDQGHENEQTPSKSAKKKWGFDGFKKWKGGESEEETTPLPLNERSDSEVHLNLVSTPIGEGPDTKLIKRKLLSDGSPGFFIDKVLGEKIKKELSRIQMELCSSNPNLKFSNEQIEAISTKLPVDKADLKKYFPKSWCDRYGDVVLDVVKKEFKDHVGEMESLRNAAREKHGMNSARWTTFNDDEENYHPNLFAPPRDHSRHSSGTSKFQESLRNAAREKHSMNSSQWTTFNDDEENCHPNLFAPPRDHSRHGSGTSKFHETNPFCDDHIHNPSGGGDGRKMRSKPSFSQDQNPFWIPGHGY